MASFFISAMKIGEMIDKIPAEWTRSKPTMELDYKICTVIDGIDVTLSQVLIGDRMSGKSKKYSAYYFADPETGGLNPKYCVDRFPDENVITYEINEAPIGIGVALVPTDTSLFIEKCISVENASLHILRLEKSQQSEYDYWFSVFPSRNNGDK